MDTKLAILAVWKPCRNHLLPILQSILERSCRSRAHDAQAPAPAGHARARDHRRDLGRSLGLSVARDLDGRLGCCRRAHVRVDERCTSTASRKTADDGEDRAAGGGHGHAARRARDVTHRFHHSMHYAAGDLGQGEGSSTSRREKARGAARMVEHIAKGALMRLRPPIESELERDAVGACDRGRLGKVRSEGVIDDEEALGDAVGRRDTSSLRAAAACATTSSRRAADLELVAKL